MIIQEKTIPKETIPERKTLVDHLFVEKNTKEEKATLKFNFSLLLEQSPGDEVNIVFPLSSEEIMPLITTKNL